MAEFTSDAQKKDYIAALLRERAHYTRYEDDERLGDVDAELARLGEQAAAPAQRRSKRVVKADETR